MPMVNRSCHHPDNSVIADICEGDAVWRGTIHKVETVSQDHNEYFVQWCQLCGSYRINGRGNWHCPVGIHTITTNSLGEPNGPQINSAYLDHLGEFP